MNKDGEPNMGFKPLSNRPKRSIKGKKYFLNLYIFCYDGNGTSMSLPRMRLPRFYQKIFLVCLAVFLAFIILEISLRIIHAESNKGDNDRSPQCKVIDSYLVHSFIPNSECYVSAKEWNVTYKINSHGWRDYEHTWGKPKDTYRILIIGDSFTEGQGVEIKQTYGKLLESEFKDQSDKKVEVITAGMAGWSPLPEYLYLGKYGLSYHPDLVILTFNTTDFRDEYFHESILTSDAKELLSDSLFNSQIFSKNDLKAFNVESKENLTLSGNRALINKFKVFLTKNFEVFKRLEQIKRSFERKTQIKSVKNNAMAITNHKKPEDYDDAFIKPKKNILRIKKLVEENNSSLVLAVFPLGHIVGGDEWARGRLEFGFEIGKTYSNQPLVDIKNWVKEQGIETLDLTDALSQAKKESSQKLYFDFDGHWTRYGNQIVADALASYLLSKVNKTTN